MLQLAPTVVFYMLPLSWCVFTYVFDLRIALNQVINDICALVSVLQSPVCVMTAVLLNKGSREFLKKKINKVLGRPVFTGMSLHNPTISVLSVRR
ncbi:unnamed protein product, partial [Mesorhabditis spiculigera]